MENRLLGLALLTNIRNKKKGSITMDLGLKNKLVLIVGSKQRELAVGLQ